MEKQGLIDFFTQVRNKSIELIKGLSDKEWRMQPINDVSPPWWNLGHTSWFFSRNILKEFGSYGKEDEDLDFYLNSYYESLGPRLARNDRGNVSYDKISNDSILKYRKSVDTRMHKLMEECDLETWNVIWPKIEIGIHHEQQHQELLLTEIKFIRNVADEESKHKPFVNRKESSDYIEGEWIDFDEGIFEFGKVEKGFSWDNELPVHKRYLQGFSLFSRPVTNGEYLEFIEDGGYTEKQITCWLSNGAAALRENKWEAPLYWFKEGGKWKHWTLGGVREIDPNEPVCHVSFYEANAFAKWKSKQKGFLGVRLPTEFELEYGIREMKEKSENFMEDGLWHPILKNGDKLLLGGVWEWTASHYEPYPGFKEFDGALMEYNGKFMDNQRVLRGGSCATPKNHIRPSYRNFWYGPDRFQFTGIRLARDFA